jgi:hypothetical protein
VLSRVYIRMSNRDREVTQISEFEGRKIGNNMFIIINNFIIYLYIVVASEKP